MADRSKKDADKSDKDGKASPEPRPWAELFGNLLKRDQNGAGSVNPGHNEGGGASAAPQSPDPECGPK